MVMYMVVQVLLCITVDITVSTYLVAALFCQQLVVSISAQATMQKIIFLSLSNGGIAVADSDKDGEGGFQLYNHWSYGNSWLELDGGALFLFGDKLMTLQLIKES